MWSIFDLGQLTFVFPVFHYAVFEETQFQGWRWLCCEGSGKDDPVLPKSQIPTVWSIYQGFRDVQNLHQIHFISHFQNNAVFPFLIRTMWGGILRLIPWKRMTIPSKLCGSKTIFLFEMPPFWGTCYVYVGGVPQRSKRKRINICQPSIFGVLCQFFGDILVSPETSFQKVVPPIMKSSQHNGPHRLWNWLPHIKADGQIWGWNKVWYHVDITYS